MVGEITNTRSRKEAEEDAERLRDWLEKQPHLPHDVEHEILLSFIYGTKSLEIAKSKLDAYFTNRNKAARFYDENGRDVNLEFKDRSKAMKHFFLTNTAPGGYRVYFISLNDCFSKEFNLLHTATQILMMLELGLKNWPDADGGYLVFDCAGVPSTVFTMLSPTIIAATLTCFQEGYPIKLKGVFCFNAPTYIEFIVNNLFKPVLKAKLFNRIKVHNDGVSSLKEYIPLELLPSNYGGNDKSSDKLNDYWMNQLEEHREWFLYSTKQVADEKKRPPDSENTYGIDGTFRKLAVD